MISLKEIIKQYYKALEEGAYKTVGERAAVREILEDLERLDND